MDMKSVCLCVLVLSLNLLSGQCLNATCPGVFDFEGTSVSKGVLRGNIAVLKPGDQEPVSILEVRINFTIAGPIIDEYRGHITPRTSNLVRKYNQGQVLLYRVHFPPTELRLPKVTAVIINGDTVCYGPGDSNAIPYHATINSHAKLVLLFDTRCRCDTKNNRYKFVKDDEGLGNRITRISLRHRSSDGNYTPVKSRPANNAVTKPVQHLPLPAPKPVITASPDHLLSNSPITTYECGVVSGGNERVPLINNGNFYERGQIPWLVAIYRNVGKNLQFICGGTLVSDRHVVTAAHCMQRPSVVTPMTEIIVKVGVHSLNDWSDDLTVIRKLMAATIHEAYNPNTLQNDVLILTLNKRVKINRYIRPACLWSGDTELSRVVGATGVVAGWGDRSVESIGGKQDEPRMVRVPIVSTKDCRGSKADFHRLTYNTTLCAGDRNGAGPCTGDSGGGLYLLESGKWRLRGVVSLSVQSENGARACNLNEYVVYTDTAQFLPWIRIILSEKYYD